MLIVERNANYVYWKPGDDVHSLEYAGDVVIAFDPSKTNMAMVIGTPEKHVLNVLEFSGNNRGRGPVMDTSVFCEEVRMFLREYLANANVYCVGVEKTILNRNRMHYHSVTVLNEIRSNLISFFLEQFQMHVIEVNNWSWKSAILPEGYRSQSEKGSKRFFTEHFPDSPYASYYEADVTDCICIFWYLCNANCSGYSVYCNRVEQSFTGFNYTYVPADSNVCKNLREVTFNPRFSLEDNLSYYSNRLLSPFCFEIDAATIDPVSVYGRTMLFERHNLKDVKVKVVAVRT